MRIFAKVLTWGVLPILCAGLALAIYGVLIEPDRVVVRNLEMTSANWPQSAPPLRIAVISDIHAGAPHIDKTKLETIVRRINAEQPDIILLLGDYVIHGVLGGRFIEPETTASYLANLQAPLGTFAVFGNHDWWFGGERVQRALEDVGITVIENGALHLKHGPHDFWLAGLADDMSRRPDGNKALEHVPTNQPVVAFMHNPAAMDQVPVRAALSLAGHTHGGQIYLPWLFAPVTPGRAGPEYAYGEITIDDKLLYVTGGIGTSILPIRINMPPEIVIITLSSGRNE